MARMLEMTVSLRMYVIRQTLFSGVWDEWCHIALTRVPVVGEFINLLASTNRLDDNWYKVVMVVHTPAEPDCVAFIFTKPVNYHEAFPIDEDDEKRLEEEDRVIESGKMPFLEGDE